MPDQRYLRAQQVKAQQDLAAAVAAAVAGIADLNAKIDAMTARLDGRTAAQAPAIHNPNPSASANMNANRKGA